MNSTQRFMSPEKVSSSVRGMVHFHLMAFVSREKPWRVIHAVLEGLFVCSRP